MGEKSAVKSDSGQGGEEYIGNIWGRKWTVIALIFILFFVGLATCRYLVIKPDRLIIPEQMEDF